MRTERRHSVAVTASTLPVLALVLMQIRALWVQGYASWSDAVHGFSPPLATAAALGLAVFVSWKAPHLREARMLDWALVFFSVNTTLAVWPFESGRMAAAWGRVATAIWPVLWVRFTMVFPRPLTVGDVGTLDGLLRARGWVGRARRGVLTALAYVIVRPWTWYALGGLWVAQFLASLLVGNMEYRPSVGLGPTETGSPAVSTLVMLVEHTTGPILLVLTATISAVFLWASYRVRDEVARSRILGVVLTSAFIASWVLVFQAMAWSVRLTGSAVLLAIAEPYATLLYPILWLAGISGLAASVLFSGAFDLRPLVRTTGIYGAVFFVITFLFAGIEEFFEGQLARFGVEGIGTWIGAGFIALAFGPIRARLDHLVTVKGFHEVPKPEELADAPLSDTA